MPASEENGCSTVSEVEVAEKEPYVVPDVGQESYLVKLDPLIDQVAVALVGAPPPRLWTSSTVPAVNWTVIWTVGPVVEGPPGPV